MSYLENCKSDFGPTWYPQRTKNFFYRTSEKFRIFQILEIILRGYQRKALFLRPDESGLNV